MYFTLATRRSVCTKGMALPVTPKAGALGDRGQSSSENNQRWLERMHGRGSEAF